MPLLKLACGTVNQTPIDWEQNKKNILEAVEAARKAHVDILCLPELCITGYGCEDLFLGEWIYEKAFEMLEEIIPECHSITVAIGLPLAYDTRHYNTTCLVQDGKPLGIYAKQFLANDGVHYEPRWFSAWPAGKVNSVKVCGNEIPLGDITFQTLGAHIGFEICEDAWRSNRPACRLVKKGVDLILNPSASHFAFGKIKLREELIITSSKDFKCTYLYANLLGNEAGRMIYDGEMLIAHHGKLAARNKWLSFSHYQLLLADIEVGNPDATAPEADVYDFRKETEFAQAAALALFDYMRKSASQGFVLSLSGGADSSTIAVLVREMVRRGIKELGKDKFIEKSGLNVPSSYSEQQIMSYILTTAYQGTVNSSQDTFDSAKGLANELGATFYQWKIDDEVSSYTQKIEHVIGRALTWERDDITLQNIQARARSPIIWMLANINNALLLTTSNRSEGDVGYTTMDGDTSGSIAPIAAVDKHFIIQWLKWAEKELGYKSLSHVNRLQPSAELRPLENTQTDENDLMPYFILVEIEKLAIRDHMSPLEVYDNLKDRNLESNELLKTHIAKFYRLWSRNQWKRERIAPAFHLDDFNVDPRTWCRFPILSGSFTDQLEKLKDA
jgi:NAD+ synthase (glutamine-hydrolysing)